MDEVQIISDLGGTNARWAQINARGKIVKPVIYQAADIPTLEASAALYVRNHVRGKITAAGLAVAGPPMEKDGRLQVTFPNSPWYCDQRSLAGIFGIPEKRIIIANDFVAAGLAINTLNPAKSFRAIRTGNPSPAHPVLVIGPGTGLGIGRLTPGKNGKSAWGTEGGWQFATAVTPRQAAHIEAWRKLHGVYSPVFEDFFSFGRGLGNLHAANRIINGERVTLDTVVPAKAIVEAARQGDILALESIRDFTFGLGAMAAQKAIDPLSFGGVLLIGLHQKLGKLFDGKLFLDGMQHHRRPELTQDIPVHHITVDVPAFEGMRYALQQTRLAPKSPPASRAGPRRITPAP